MAFSLILTIHYYLQRPAGRPAGDSFPLCFER
jgi:hypothetical protein